MRRFVCFGIAFVASAWIGPAAAQTKQQLNWCNGQNNATPQQRVVGCDAGIKTGKYKGAQLGPFYINRGRGHADMGNLDRAMADYDQGLRLAPRDLAGLLNRSNAYSERGDFDRAFADLDRAISINAKFVLGYYNRGSLFIKKGDHERAIQDFNTAIKIDSKYIPAYVNRGNAYSVLRRYDEAIADATTALKLLPQGTSNAQRALILGNRGGSYGLSKNQQRSIADLSEAIELDPQRRFRLARQASYDLNGQPELALPDVEELVKSDPKDHIGWQKRCWIRARLGRLDEARADCDHSLELRPINPSARHAIGYIYAKQKQFDKAIAELDIAIKDSGYVEGGAIERNYAEVLYFRGITRLRNGDALGGAADMATAKATKSDVAEDFSHYGL